MGKKKKMMLVIAERNFKMWNDALQSGDPKKVTDLYCSKSIFLPT